MENEAVVNSMPKAIWPGNFTLLMVLGSMIYGVGNELEKDIKELASKYAKCSGTAQFDKETPNK